MQNIHWRRGPGGEQAGSTRPTLLPRRIPMNTTEIEAARKALGPVGVCLPVEFTTALDVGAQRDAVRRLESAGYGAVWTNEVIGGKDVLVQLAVLLGPPGGMVLGSSIPNIGAREPQTAHGGAA